jgi:diketogulonate reductase-like aldo/keto reductase
MQEYPMQNVEAHDVKVHGASIPMIGLGTMTLKEDVCVQAVKNALQMGYRHIDTAWFYGNEKEVGEGIRQSGVRRDEIFLTTKVRETHLMGDKFRQSLDESLANLKVPQVDLLLIHWNNKDVPLKESIGSLCKAKKDGLAKHVGVANFTTALLKEAWDVTSEPLVCNQIEMHPLINQDKVIAACKAKGMALVAYCPAVRGKGTGNEVLERIGKAHGKSWVQVALRFLVQQGFIAIPRTATPAHMKENMEVFDFTLSDAEMKDITALKASHTRVVNPPHAPVWDTP